MKRNRMKMSFNLVIKFLENINLEKRIPKI